MNLQGRNLASGTQGADVALLQKELGQLGLANPAARNAAHNLRHCCTAV